MYSIEYDVSMYTILRTDEFARWLDGLKDRMVRARLNTRLAKVARGLLGDVKPVGDGVFEMRENFGPGWRMYYTQKGDVIVIMLGGGDKGTQQADIAAAQKLAATIEEQAP